MTAAVFFKTLADICFFLIFACFFGSFAGFQGSLLPSAVLFSMAMFCCAAVAQKADDKRLRFLPLLICGASWLTGPGLVGSLLLLPPLAYCVYMTAKMRFSPDHMVCAENFPTFLKILILPLGLALFSGQKDRLNTYALPYLLVYLLVSVLLLRMLRHDRKTMKSARFQLVNALSIGLAALASLLFFSEGFRSAVKAVISWFYLNLIAPLLILFSYVLGGIAWLVSKFLSLVIDGEEAAEETSSLSMQLEKVLEDLESSGVDPFWQTLGKVMFGAAVAALAVSFLIWLFRRLSQNGQQKRDENGVVITRSSLAETEPSARPLRRMDARTPETKVRYCYQKLLAYTEQAGFELLPQYDSARHEAAQEKLFPEYKAELEEMRRLYLPARYGGEVPEADARRAKEILRSVTRRIKRT